MKVLKNYLSILILTGIFSMNGLAQTLQKANLQAHDSFQQRMAFYVSTYLAQDNVLDRVRDRYTTENVENLTRQEFREMATGLARTEFVGRHLEEFKQLYMSAASPSAVTTSVCDNGGFESGFTGYNGFVSDSFRSGSATCEPLDTFNSVFNYTSSSLPTESRFEIVSSGTDSLVGIQRTKFGNKALRINHRYSKNGTRCDGNYRIDKLTKEFTVTADNREFTVWYAFVSENPANHENKQPFFSIKCDLAPNNDLCFDADYLNCEDVYSDQYCEFDSIDVLDWSCHRIIIPEEEIGNTATLSIVASDCGLGAHFGYAYVDGICENCLGGATGSISLTGIDSCEFDSLICGSYQIPEICDTEWSLDTIVIPGVNVLDFTLNTSTKTFCFKLPSSEIEEDSCIDVFAQAVFKGDGLTTDTVFSNLLRICEEYYTPILSGVNVTGCNDNETSPNISDDYYFVGVGIQRATGLSWTMTQELDDPYPNESGIRELDTGSGNGNIQLGPFFVQEGSWELDITIGDCSYTEYIIPPDYCSGCNEFREVVIDNIQCDDITGEWSFDVYVPTQIGTSDAYTLTLDGTGYNCTKGTTCNISSLMVSTECLTGTFTRGQSCEASFVICPPKPCAGDCDIEAYIEEVPCEDDSGIDFSVDLKVEDYSGYLCYEATTTSGSSLSSGSLTGSQIVGTFDEDIYLTIYECANSDCSTNCDPPDCYKVFYVPLPEADLCEEVGALILGAKKEEQTMNSAVRILNNPLNSGQIIILSARNQFEAQIVSQDGKVLQSFVITKGKNHLSLIVPVGFYIFRYKDENDEFNSIKFIKH